MTNADLTRWLDLGLFHFLVSLGVFQHNEGKSSRYDELLDIEKQIGVMANAAATNGLTRDEDPWPRINPCTITRQAWELGYIEEAMRAKSALEQLGMWDDVT